MQLNPKKNLRLGIMLYFLTAISLPLVILLFIVFRQFQQDLHSQLVRRIETLHKLIKGDWDKKLGQFKENLVNQSREDFVIGLVEAGDLAEQSLEMLVSHLKKVSNVESVTVYSYSGKLIASTDKASAALELDSGLLGNIESRKEEKLPVYLKYSQDKRRLRIDAYAPVVEPFYKYLFGILQETIFIDSNYIEQIKQDAGLEAALFKQREAFIYTTPQEPVVDYRVYSELKQSKKMVEQDNIFIGPSSYHLILEPILGEGREFFGAIGLFISQKSVIENKKFLGRLFIIFTGIIFILAFILGYLFSRQISKPILTIVEALRGFGKSHSFHRIKIRSKDEIGELSAAFNKMSENLQKREEELVKANEELNEWGVTLEEKIEEKAAELKAVQAKLVQSAKMAAVGQLAGGIAHEINNPLTGVLNNVQLIKMELADKKEHSLSDFKELLNVIEESAQRCKRIVRNLLDFSHMGKGVCEAADINNLLEKSLIVTYNELAFHNIKVVKEYTPGLPGVMVDINQFLQVFLDIFNNARWAMRITAQAELKIKTFLSQDAQYAVTEISDNGCGIEKENLWRIFEPFFTTKPPGEGTGLGLSICYQIIRDHGGSIEAKSEGKAQGTTFIINLPAIKNIPIAEPFIPKAA